MDEILKEIFDLFHCLVVDEKEIVVQVAVMLLMDVVKHHEDWLVVN
jgi:hypothetical protein